MGTAISLFLIPMLINLSIGVWFLAKRPGMNSNRLVFLVCTIFGYWGAAEFLKFFASTGGQAMFLDHALILLISILPLLSWMFLREIERESGDVPPPQAWVPAGLGVIIVACGVVNIGTDLVIRSAASFGGRWVCQYGPLYGPVLLAPLLPLIAFHGWIFYRGCKRPGEKARRIKMVVGLSPLVPVLGGVGLGVLPEMIAGHTVTLTGYPSSIFFGLVLGIASHRIGLMTITPEHAARQAIDALRDGLLLVDRDWNVRHASAGVFRLLSEAGNSGEIGNLRDALRIRSEQEKDFLERDFETVPEEADLRADLVTGSGGSVPVIAAFHKWVAPGGEHAGAIVVLRDERPIRRLQTEWFHVEKMRALSTMVSGLAHELNNPLTTIIGFSEMGRNPLPAERARRYFDTVYEQARRAQGVVKTLSDFCGGSAAFEAPVHAEVLVSELVRVRRFDLESAGVSTEESYEPDLPATVLDPQKLKQAVLNVFNNAAEAAEENTGKGRVSVDVRRGGNAIRIRIADNGRGMDEETLGKVFDPFFTTKGPQEGMGLGLSVAHSLVSGMGGRIEAASTPGEGSVFTLVLPVASGAPKRRKPPSSSLIYEKMTAKPHVLIVDDDKVFVEMIANFLALKGCTVDTAFDGTEGLEKIGGEDHDVILCDVRMPNLDGRAMVDRIRKERPEVLEKIIICSGDTVAGDTRRFLKASGLRTLNKPFTLKELAAELRGLLSDSAVFRNGGASYSS